MNDPSPDQAARRLTAALARGEAWAVEAFYRESFDVMLADVRRATGLCEADALDVVQDATLKIVAKARAMPTEVDWRRWTRRVVLNAAIDLVRRDGRRRRREARRPAGEATPGPADHAAIAEQVDRLRREVAKLDDDDQRMLSQRHGDGLTLAAIGRRLGRSAGAVDGRLRRLRERLANALKEIRP